jgi:hypothetical protein
MEDPRKLPRPEEPTEKVIALARDLAYGFKVDDWAPLITVSRDQLVQLYET